MVRTAPFAGAGACRRFAPWTIYSESFRRSGECGLLPLVSCHPSLTPLVTWCGVGRHAELPPPNHCQHGLLLRVGPNSQS